MKNLGAPKARPPPRPVSASRSGSIRSTKSSKKPIEEPAESSEDEGPSVSRRKSLSRKKSDASSKPPSRAPSRASRKRADSAATAPSDKEEKEKEKPKPEKSSNRLSVVGSWGAVSSMIGRGKKDKEKDKDKNKEKFAELDSDESETDEFGVAKRHKHRSSIPGLPSTSPKIPSRLLKSFSNDKDKDKDSAKDKDKENRKRVVALHDFAAGSTDELSFKAGDQIDVVSEVLDGWWMGELDGQRGLFPTTYTEVINSSHSSLPPPLPYRPASSVARALSLSNGAKKNSTSSYSSLEDTEHPFGDHNARKGKSNKGYEGSIQSSVFTDDDDDSSSLMHVQRVDDILSSKYMTGLPAPAPASAPASVPPPIPMRREATTGSTPKKAPPPPPPRRSTLSSSASPTPPPVPSRPATLRTHSSASSSYSTLAVTGTTDPDGLTYSPFDSPMEEKTRFDCREFKQNPFKPQGFCSNCFKLHY